MSRGNRAPGATNRSRRHAPVHGTEPVGKVSVDVEVKETAGGALASVARVPRPLPGTKSSEFGGGQLAARPWGHPAARSSDGRARRPLDRRMVTA